MKRTRRFRPVALIATALAAGIVTTACAAKPRRTTVSGQNDTHRTDSVVIERTVRDTVVRIERDSSLLRALLVCDSLGRIQLQQITEYRAGQRVHPPALSIEDNVLTARVEVDSIAMAVQISDYLERHFRLESAVTTRTVEVEVNRLTWWQTLWVNAGKIAAIAFALFLGCKRFIPKIKTLLRGR